MTSTPEFDLREDDLTGDAVRALLALHLSGMRTSSPPGAVFALDLSGLRTPDVTVWTAWRADRLAGVGALKLLAGGDAEVKSMRTHPAFLRQGVATAILQMMIASATARGIYRLSLETGRGPSFEAALALYRRRGFVEGNAFGDYVPNGFSQYLHLTLPV
jgi:putative acetyltransferase